RKDLKSESHYTSNETGQAATRNDVAGTAFGLLPFLGAGMTHKSTGKEALYVKTVEKAINWLKRKQGQDGDFGGGMYAHGLATIAICEAYGLTSDATLKRNAQAALDFIVKAQDQTRGGWRYSPRSDSDTSVTGWHLMALKSGQMSGLHVPMATLKNVERWLDFCESSDKGGYGYVGPQESPAMTAVGLLCRQYLGMPPRHPNLLKGIDKLKRWPPGTLNNIYYDYYATQVMHHAGGDAWQFWNEGPKKNRDGMRDRLIDTQEAGGSWNPAGDAFAREG